MNLQLPRVFTSVVAMLAQLEGRLADPESVHERVFAADIVKEPRRSWYGMNELYLRNPDGYVIYIGALD